MGITWDSKPDDDSFLGDNSWNELFDEEEVELIVLTFPPLPPLFSHLLYVMSGDRVSQ